MVSRSGTTNRNQRKVTTSIEWYQHNMVQLNQIAKNMELVTRSPSLTGLAISFIVSDALLFRVDVVV